MIFLGLSDIKLRWICNLFTEAVLIGTIKVQGCYKESKETVGVAAVLIRLSKGLQKEKMCKLLYTIFADCGPILDLNHRHQFQIPCSSV